MIKGEQEGNDSRAEVLFQLLTDYDLLRAWVRNHPQRVAVLLGVCEEGERFIRERVSVALGAQHSLTGGTIMEKATGSGSGGSETGSSNQDDKKMSVQEGIELAKEGLKLLEEGVKRKKKAEKLSALVTALRHVCALKSGLIQRYEEGNVPPEKQQKAKDLHARLRRLQDKLADIHDKIERDEDVTKDVQEASREIEKLMRDLNGRTAAPRVTRAAGGHL